MYKYLLPIFLILQVNLFANFNLFSDTIATEGEDFTLWVALFGLGLISIFALFLSSDQVKKLKKKYKKEEALTQKKNKVQDAIISKMGEDIYDITKKSITTSNTAKSENQLLAITTNLIDFLRIKSKKVIIDHQILKLSN